MRWKWTLLMAALLAATLPAEHSVAGSVVGLREPRHDFFVAVRGEIAAGTVITAIQFFSNDATTFPQVFLAADVDEGGLPHPGTALRSVADVEGAAGYVTVPIPAYEVHENTYLWAVVRFPDNTPMLASGVGGGPGIGWRTSPGLDNERSLFSVEGSLNEFKPDFDVTLLTASAGAAAMSKLETEAPNPPRTLAVSTQVEPTSRGTVFALELPRNSNVALEVFTIAGQRLMREDRILAAGTHELVWRGLDASGRRVASGIYLYRVQVDQERRTGKIAVVR